MAIYNINSQRLPIIPVPFDAKRTNCYIDGSDIVIETLGEYLVRITNDIRDVAPVTMLLPKAGYSAGTFSLSTFDAELANFDVVLYAFIGGVQDVNFVQVFPMNPSEYFKAVSIEYPTSVEDIAMFYVTDDITITNIHAVVRGSSVPSVTINPVQTLDRSAAGTAILNSPTAITNTTVGQNLTSFNDETVPAGSWIVIKTTDQSGTVNELNITIIYTIDV